jgi:hypothetical protein
MRFFALAAIAVATAGPLRAADLGFEKYLLDDTDGVLTLDVQNALKSKVYEKNAKALVDGFLGADPAKTILADFGIDPRTDLTRVTLTTATSLHRTTQRKLPGGATTTSHGGDPLVVIQGKFDAKKIRAAAEKLDENTVTVREADGWVVYEIRNPVRLEDDQRYYAAIVDANTIVVTAYRDLIDLAFERAAGRKKVALVKPMAELLKGFEPDTAVQWAASSAFITGTSFSSVQGGNGPAQFTTKHQTLADDKIESNTGSVKLDGDLEFRLHITFATADDAAAAAKKAEEVRERAVKALESGEGIGAAEKELVPLAVPLFKATKFETKDRTLTTSLKIEGDALAKIAPTAAKLFWRGRL